MADNVEKVGVRLSLTGSTAFVRDMGAATDSVKAFTDAMGDAAAMADSTGAKMGAGAAEQVAATREATQATRDLQGALEGSAVTTTKTKGATDDAVESTKKLEKAHSSLASTIAKSPIGTLGKWGTGGALVAAYESVKGWTEYQKSMTQLVTQAGVAHSQLPGLMQGGLTIAKQTGLHFTTVANQLYRISSASAGLKETNKQLLAMERSAANLAVLFQTAPGGQTEQLSRIVGVLQNAGRNGKLQTVGTPKHAAALMNATAGAGDIRGATLISALGKGVLQSGQAVGAKLPDILAWIATSTHFGANASTAGTLIAHSLQQIATPSAQGQHAEMMFGLGAGTLKNIIAKTGIGAAITKLTGNIKKGLTILTYYPSNAIGGAENLPGAQSALAQLTSWGLSPTLITAAQNHTMTAQQQSQLEQFMLTKIFGGARQEIPILTLAENPKRMGQIESAILSNANTKHYHNDVNMALNTPSQQIAKAERGIEYYGMQAGKTLTPMVISSLHGVEAFLTWMSKHSAVLKGLVGTLGAATAVGAGAIVIDKMGKMFKAIGAIGGAGSSAIDKILKMFGLGGLPGSAQGGLTGAATALKGSATALDEAAAALKESTGVGGKGGGGTSGAEKDLETGAEDVGGVAGASWLSRLTGLSGVAGIESLGIGPLASVLAGNFLTPNNRNKSTLAILKSALNPFATNGTAPSTHPASNISTKLLGTIKWLEKHQNKLNAYMQTMLTTPAHPHQIDWNAFGPRSSWSKSTQTAMSYYDKLHPGFAAQQNKRYQTEQTNAIQQSAAKELKNYLNLFVKNPGHPGYTLLSHKSTGMVAINAQNDVNKTLKASAKSLQTAADKHLGAAATKWIDTVRLQTSASKLQNDASKQQQMAAKDAQTGSKKMQSAAKEHTKAAQKLSTAADALNAVAATLQTAGSSISPANIAALAKAGNAQAQGRR